MLFMALCELKNLSCEKRTQQATDLADVFHNLPNGMWHDSFSLTYFRESLENYRHKYPGNLSIDYLTMLDEING
jgi:hypothetical protein